VDAIPLHKVNMHVVVTVFLKDGTRLARRVDALLGEAGNPLTREQRLRKFFGCTRRVLPAEGAERMLALVERLETLPDITEITDIARCEGAAVQ
jgi:2-methylcitrate dehydratase PrpD